MLPSQTNRRQAGDVEAGTGFVEINLTVHLSDHSSLPQTYNLENTCR